MLTSWRLKHFKSVYDETTLELAPLTVFAGANSSGKTTLIHSILLTAQTLQSSVQAKSVVLNGNIVRLGTFNDILSNRSDDQIVSIGFGLDIQDSESLMLRANNSRYWHYYPIYRNLSQRIRCEFAFSATGVTENSKDFSQLQPRLESCKITAETEDKKSQEVKIVRSQRSLESRVIKYKLKGAQLTQADINSLEYDVTCLPNNPRHRHILDSSAEIVGAVPSHFLPERLSVVFDSIESRCNKMLQVLLTPNEHYYYALEGLEPFSESFPPEFVAALRNAFAELSSEKDIDPRWLAIAKQIDKDFEQGHYEDVITRYLKLPNAARRVFSQKFGQHEAAFKSAIIGSKSPSYEMTFVEPPEACAAAMQTLQQFFSQRVKYLGPLRDEPKPIYPLSGTSDPMDVGFKGEHTAAVLDLNLKKLVTYISSDDINSTQKPNQSKGTLLEAVLDWLKYMGVACDVKTHDRDKLGHELLISVSESDTFHDLTHVGVGVSQVLPILVLSLLADQGSVLIFEQPELHLHPRIQSRLADFFVSMMLLGKQCIIETHSEYLLTRLRLRAAKQRHYNLPDKTAIYFVEKISGKSFYRPISMNEFGTLSHWPKGFFDEIEENSAAIMQANMERRREKKE
ncbi:MAG: DUF3696 domain-containing protein [Candidatus Obscuribacterales bacterium]